MMPFRADFLAVRDRDPACRGRLDTLVSYPGLWAVWSYRVAHRFWCRGNRRAARLLSTLTRLVTGVELHPAAQLGSGLFIDHGAGVVVGETSVCGHNVTLYQGATLGGTHLLPGKRHPTLGSNVVVGAGAKILGPVTLKDGVVVGANSVVVTDIPEKSLVVGVPGRVVKTGYTHRNVQPGSDIDSISRRFDEVFQRLEAIETSLGRGDAPRAQAPLDK